MADAYEMVHVTIFHRATLKCVSDTYKHANGERKTLQQLKDIFMSIRGGVLFPVKDADVAYNTLLQHIKDLQLQLTQYRYLLFEKNEPEIMRDMWHTTGLSGCCLTATAQDLLDVAINHYSQQSK